MRIKLFAELITLSLAQGSEERVFQLLILIVEVVIALGVCNI